MSNNEWAFTIGGVVLYLVIGVFSSMSQQSVERGMAFVFFWPIAGLVLALRGLFDIIQEAFF